MESLSQLLMGLTLLILAPLAVGALMGVDRRITARMQNRVGPPLLQPFYDVLKLAGKERRLMNEGQGYFALVCLLFEGAALAVLVFGGDLLTVFFLSGAGSFFFAIGAFSARSPFSQMGAHRELLQILAYEPVFFMVLISIAIQQRSFLASDIDGMLLGYLPLSMAALFLVLVIKLQKSPYDIAYAHSELASGPLVEYSGPYLAVLEISKWVEVAVVYGIFTLFWNDPDLLISVLGKVAIVLIALFATMVVDNTTARLTRSRMVAFTLSLGIALVAANLFWNMYLAPAVLP